jgi:hypothetical protein
MTIMNQIVLKNSIVKKTVIPESTKDIKQQSLQISQPACTMLEPRSTDNSGQSIMNNKVSMQPCSYLQTVEDGSHDQQEDM